MAETTNPSQADWTRLQVYVPPDFYAVLQARAKHRGVSLSSEGLRLMRLGLANIKPSETVSEDLAVIKRFLELHLEPLAFVAAMDAAKVAAYEKQRIAAQRQLYLASNPRSDGKDDSEQQANFIDRQMAERATHRIQRVLRGIESPAFGLEAEGEEGDHADKENAE